jgi:vacuolar-type H+-ATPase subunit E/Vma4
LLTLRQEINALLDKLITRELHDALTPEHLFKVLSSTIRSSCTQEGTDIVISLNEEDLKSLEGGFLSKLKAETKKEIVLKPAESIKGGFVISFDAGKSQFDFSERALAEYIGTLLKPKLKEILEGEN